MESTKLLERDFEGRVVLVTGAASGIGLTIAEAFLHRGAKVAFADIDEKKLEELKENVDTNALILSLDVSNEAEVKEKIKKLIKEFKRVDILVNNAGIALDNLALRMKLDEFHRVIKINLEGAFLCTREVISCMIKNKWGRIINIASVIGVELGNIGQVNYAASKAGIIGMTKTLGIELARWNITVNAICPGFIETPLTGRIPQDRRDKLLNIIPLRRFGKPEEVAALALFLSSDTAAYITGQIIVIDGGLSITPAAIY